MDANRQHREQTCNFLYAQYDAKGYHRTGRWLQCAYCKIWYPRHMTMPTIPAADVENWHVHHHNLCFSCTRSSLDNQLLHPGTWLNVIWDSFRIIFLETWCCFSLKVSIVLAIFWGKSGHSLCWVCSIRLRTWFFFESMFFWIPRC